MENRGTVRDVVAITNLSEPRIRQLDNVLQPYRLPGGWRVYDLERVRRFAEERAARSTGRFGR